MRNLKNYQSLKSKWEKLQSEDNKIRIRDAAKKLGTSEASLLSTEINDGVFFLNISDYHTFLSEVLSLDKIMLLIRSDSVVHEKTISSKDIQLRDNKVFNNKSNELILIICLTIIIWLSTFLIQVPIHKTLSFKKDSKKITAEQIPISKIPLVSSMSGKMNILRVYTQQSNRKKVEITAKSILDELK